MNTNEEILRQYFQACIDCDTDRALSFMTEDIVYIDHAMGFHARNKTYLRKAWNRYFEICDNSDHASILHTMHITPSGEYVIEWTERTRLNRDWEFLRATGKAYEVRGTSVGFMRDGLIYHNSDYYDLTTILRQSGIAEIPTIPEINL